MVGNRTMMFQLAPAGAGSKPGASANGRSANGSDDESGHEASENEQPNESSGSPATPFRNGDADPRSLLDRIQVAVFATDRVGRLTALNQAWHQLTGIPVEESLGTSLGAYLAAEDPNKTGKLLAELLAGDREELRQEVAIGMRDGRIRWLDWQARVTRAPNGAVRGCSGTLVDISERRWVEQSSRLFSEHLQRRVAERTQALEAANSDLESFAYAVSHELRAPLRIILGYASILRENADLISDPENKLCITQIETSSRRMAALIERMLHYSRVGHIGLRQRQVDCTALLREVIAGLAPETASRQIDFVVNVGGACWADPVLLRQVFENLVGNAVKYTRGREQARIEITGERDGDVMVFSVRDNGIGFDLGHARDLFTVFHRLHAEQEFEGSGVGLATVKRIVERHGGWIWVEARKNEGAVFHFTLPSQPADQRERPE